MSKKIYKCCICHEVLENKPHRLVHQEYDSSKYYGLYKNKHNYDFCTECFKRFRYWIRKHEDTTNE